jgi:hypothetical protein
MVEPVTTIGLGAITAYLGKDGLQKLLGPTAEYLGDELKDFTQRRFNTVGKIFSNASQKLGSKLNQSGAIPPKLLKQVIDGGSFADDTVEIEYLGGVMASSRSDDSRDNRGVRIAKLIDNLSNYQLRAHYIVYRSIKDIFQNSGISPNMDGRAKLRIYLPMTEFIDAMQFSPSELSKLNTIISHTFFGLHAENLIENHFEYGPIERMQAILPTASDGGVVCHK